MPGGSSTHLDGRAWHLPVDDQHRDACAVRDDAFLPRAVVQVVGAAVAGAAHRVVLLRVEMVVASAGLALHAGTLALVAAICRGRHSDGDRAW